jgi:hypothetical protein
MPPRLALNSAFCFDQDERFLLPNLLSPFCWFWTSCRDVFQLVKKSRVDRTRLLLGLLVVETALFEFRFARNVDA